MHEFLKESTHYDKARAVEVCGNGGMFKEQAYLYFIMGKKNDGVQILVEKCTDDMEYAIQLAV